ncbi:MAG: phosphopantothenoylcysteine decarboxylase, partial [Marinilabiliales bacterium]
IDPVRFIGNRSSGKMGYAIAAELYRMGADVTLISGPVDLKVPEGIKKIEVESASQMYDASMEIFNQMDIAVLSAAVADYRPSKKNETKVKSASDTFDLHLVATQDIAKSLGENKSDKQMLIGFALETDHEEENAILKLKKKNLDFIVLNSLNDKGAGFSVDTNKISILYPDNKKEYFELKSKQDVAKDIVQRIIDRFNA